LTEAQIAHNNTSSERPSKGSMAWYWWTVGIIVGLIALLEVNDE